MFWATSMASWCSATVTPTSSGLSPPCCRDACVAPTRWKPCHGPFAVPVGSRSSRPVGWRFPPIQRTGQRAALPCWATTPSLAPAVLGLQHRFRIKVGPMPLPPLPGQFCLMARPTPSCDLVSLYVGPEWNGSSCPCWVGPEVLPTAGWEAKAAAGLWSSWLACATRDSDAGDLSLAMGARLA